jgi:hypothetical protein
VATDSDKWDEVRLQALIVDRVEERFDLEYKAAAALDDKAKNDITKDISAMANSAGGTIIYGLAQFDDAAREHLPERITAVDRVAFSKEWLEQMTSQIRPRIPDLRIHSIQLSTGPDNVVYVVEVPQGTTAHQARDFRYYRRYNFEAVPMADHEIRDVMNRRAHPRIVVRASLCFFHGRKLQSGADGRLSFFLTNQSDVFARYIMLIAHAPIKIRNVTVAYDVPNKILEVTDDGIGHKLIFSNHIGSPLFPRASLNPYFEFKSVAGIEHEQERLLNNYKFSLFADSMPVQHGAFTLEEILRE